MTSTVQIDPHLQEQLRVAAVALAGSGGDQSDSVVNHILALEGSPACADLESKHLFRFGVQTVGDKNFIVFLVS